MSSFDPMTGRPINSNSPVSEYDTKSGDYEMELMEGSNSIIFKGNLKSTSKGASFSLDEIEEYGKKEDVSLAFTVEKGASMEAFDGEEINIGTATEEELKDVVSEFNY